jgi:type I restriction enzyme, S subunit
VSNLATLAEIFEFIRNGKSIKQDKSTGGLPITRIETIADGTVDCSRVGYAGLQEAGNERWLLKKGDILFSHINSVEHIGKCALFEGHPEKLIHGMNLLALRPSKRVLDPRYAFRVMSGPIFRNSLAQFVNKAVNQASISTTNLKSLKIPLPPLDEQRRIAAILDKADALRRKRMRTLELIDRAAESIFSEIFGDQVNNPRSTKRIECLGSLAEIVSGITKGRKVNGSPTRSVPYLAVVNVQDKRLNLDVVKTIDATEDEIRRYRLHMNDLLLTEGGDPDKLGRGTLWRQEIDEAIHQNHIFRVRLTSREVLPIYLMWLIGSPYGKAYFLRSAKQTTGIASINKTQLSDFPVIVPPIELQMKFAAAVDAVSRVAGMGLSNSRAIDALFFSLQSCAFSGQL